MSPTLSRRQTTLSHLLSGPGLASDDSASLKKICIALADDAELDTTEADEQTLSAAAKRLASLSMAASSLR